MTLEQFSNKLYESKILHDYKDGKIDYRKVHDWIVSLKPQCVQTDVSKSVLLPQDLSHIFKNVNHKPCAVIGYDFAWDVTKNGKLIGELFYSNDDKEWWFIKDNFPHQRKSYRINFPIKEDVFFIELFKTIGIELIK